MIFFFLLLSIFGGPAAEAACSYPTGVTGQTQFFPSAFKYCDGTNWFPMNLNPPGGACTGAGKMDYAGGVMRYCDGSLYVSMAGGLSNVACTTGGMIRYNSTSNWMEWCDGSFWNVVRLGPTAYTIYLTSGASFTVPADWNNTANSIEVIGAGGGGAQRNASYSGIGGGGGAYTKVNNINLTAGATVAFGIGAGGTGGVSGSGPGGNGGDTYFCNSPANCASILGTAVVAGAKGGAGGGVAGASIPGAGGAAASSVPASGFTLRYSGGSGGANVGGWGGTGGGGSAGPAGDGLAGGKDLGSTATATGGGGGGAGGGTVGADGIAAAGGAGGAAFTTVAGGAGATAVGSSGVAGAGGAGGGGGRGHGSTAGGSGGAGGNGLDWAAFYGAGAGGGAGAAGNTTGGKGGNGGLYGGGGGGGGNYVSTALGGGNGAQGLIVLTYADPCAAVAIGAPCAGTTALKAGMFNNIRLMVTPSGCTDSANPTCAGGLDTVVKYWNGTGGTSVDIGGIANIATIATKSAYAQGGDTVTPLIVAAGSVTADSAAHYCSNMIYGGYSDWYLPSKSELAFIYCHTTVPAHGASYPHEAPNCTAYGGKSGELTNFASDWYWAANEGSAANAATQSFYSGEQLITFPKQTSFPIRCLRRY